MSQSTTIYSISKRLFEELKKSENRREIEIHKKAKKYYTFQNSFLGIEFVITKNKSETDKKILSQIFNPSEYLGNFDFENSDLDEMMDFMESGNYFPYLNHEKLVVISKLLSEIEELEIKDKYDADELSENDIYPSKWAYENHNGQSCNLNHLIEDFSELKKIIVEASEEENYLLICTC